MVQFDDSRQDARLAVLRKKEEEDLAKTLAEKYDVPYVDLSLHPINTDSLRILPVNDAKAANIAVFDNTDKKIAVAAISPLANETRLAIENLEKAGYTPTVYMVSHASLDKVWSRYKDLSYSFETKSGALDISNEQIVDIVSKVNGLEDIKKLIEEVLAMKKAFRISRVLEIILAGSIALKASDVHIEPEDKEVRLRYRLDGVLTDILHFDKETFELLLSRIKLVSELKLNVKDRAQDGRFSIKIRDSEIEIRTSLLPGPYGESVVLRVLNPDTIAAELKGLGIHPLLLEIFEREIKKPTGMILTTGPTGSGKTTTLYAFLKEIYSPDIKVITIENPIEYHLSGIVQTQTEPDKGYTFAEGLRSALRQDPDVIMVGEIRDDETASVAVNAALTGHLVLSTLHTNDAAGSFPRLLDLGINPKVISSAINISIAQRLIRKLCDKCKKETPLEGANKEVIEKIFNSIADPRYKEGVMPDKMYSPVGCPECSGLGYKGRTGIYEAILIDKAIEDAVIKNPSERDIRDAATPQKLLTLAQDGILKVLSGTTSIEELARVVDLSV